MLSVESSALSALRAIEMEAARNGAGAVNLRLAPPVGLYILNEKWANLIRLHQQQGLYVQIQLDDSVGHAEHEIERTSHVADGEGHPPPPAIVALTQFPEEPEEPDFIEEEEDEEEEAELEAEGGTETDAGTETATDGSGRRRRRRRRGRRGDEGPDGGLRRSEGEGDALAAEDDAGSTDGAPAADGEDAGEDAESRSRRRRRRGRRGGRRPREEGAPAEGYAWTRARTPDGADPYGWYDTAADPANQAGGVPANDVGRSPAVGPSSEPPSARAPTPAPASKVESQEVWVELASEPAAPKPPRRGRGRAAVAAAAPPADPQVIEATASGPPTPQAANELADGELAKPARRPRRTKAAAPAVEAVDAEAAPAPAPVLAPVTTEPEPPRAQDPTEVTAPPAAPRRGWWRRG